MVRRSLIRKDNKETTVWNRWGALRIRQNGSRKCLEFYCFELRDSFGFILACIPLIKAGPYGAIDGDVFAKMENYQN
jgi:hypothetical protein